LNITNKQTLLLYGEAIAFRRSDEFRPLKCVRFQLAFCRRYK